MRFSHILVATDFSERGDHALPFGLELGREYGARVTLCHVLEAVRPPNPLYAASYPRDLFRPDLLRQAERDAERALRERVPACYGDLATDVAASHGDAADEIVRHAEERGCDLIVIAAGRHRRHLLLGSVAEKVVRRAQCAVLIVR